MKKHIVKRLAPTAKVCPLDLEEAAAYSHQDEVQRCGKKIIFSWSLRSHASRAKIFLGLLFGVMFKLASVSVTRSLLELKAYLPKD